MVLDYNEDRSLELPLMNEQTSDWHNTMTMNLDPARSIKTPKSSLKLSQISKAMVEQPIRWQQWRGWQLQMLSLICHLNTEAVRLSCSRNVKLEGYSKSANVFLVRDFWNIPRALQTTKGHQEVQSKRQRLYWGKVYSKLQLQFHLRRSSCWYPSIGTCRYGT